MIKEYFHKFFSALKDRNYIYTLALCFLFAGSAQERQNVVMIIADDLNDWIEPYGGHPQTKTPNISRLASQGLTFTNVWPTVSWCNPSRVSLITGIHPFQSGILSNDHYPFRDYLKHASTLMDSFNEAGYYTIGFGKILHKPTEDEVESWKEYYPYNIIPKPGVIPAHNVQEIIDLNNESYDWGPLNVSRTEWGDYKSVSHAIDFLNSGQAQNEPFFMTIGLRLPHLPFYYPEEFDDFLEDLVIELPNDSVSEEMKAQKSFDLMKKNGVWDEAVKSYLSCINFVDYNIGRFLDALKANKELDDNTIIIFISDHGYHIGGKQRWGKVTLWNEALRTPCIVRFPHLYAKAGQEIHSPINLIDIYPTLSEFLKLKSNPWFAGENFLKLVDSTDEETENFSVLPDHRFAYTDNNYKYINGRHEMLFTSEDFNELDFKSALNQNLSLVTYYRERANQIYQNGYLPFERPMLVEGVEFDLGTNGILVSWDDSDKKEIYQIRVCEGFNCTKEEIQGFTVDSSSIELGYFSKFSIRSINPKYASRWSNQFNFLEIISEWPIEKIFELNPAVSVYDFSGREIELKSKFSYLDFIEELQLKGGALFLVRFQFGSQTLIKKILLSE